MVMATILFGLIHQQPLERGPIVQLVVLIEGEVRKRFTRGPVSGIQFGWHVPISCVKVVRGDHEHNNMTGMTSIFGD